ncbi:MAG: enolase C-terminal domain-like protein [Ilumatobacter sp.]
MNPNPDYSAAYLELMTSDGEVGHGFVFTIGNGNDVQVAAIEAHLPLVIGRDVDEVLADMGGFSRGLVGDSQLRWLGPEKGVIHMAAGAVINAVWDLRARRAGVPLWKLLADLSPAEIVDLIDFRYIADALSKDEALRILEAGLDGRADRERLLLESGYPAYTTTPGWLGYSDEKLAALSSAAVDDGFDLIKLKVGADPAGDHRRLGIARDTVGPDVKIAIDANQVWGVADAIRSTNALAEFDPYWIEEPTSPDDVVGHATIRKGVAPIKVATGEHAHNSIVFKQLLQLDAIDILQLDATRVGGVNENIAIVLLAAKFGVPVCPHAGGVGLCELVRHLSMFDFLAVSATLEDRRIEYVDHLHEHFTDPVVIRTGRYVTPTAPGMSAQMHDASLAEFIFPTGAAWTTDRTAEGARHE